MRIKSIIIFVFSLSCTLSATHAQESIKTNELQFPKDFSVKEVKVPFNEYTTTRICNPPIHLKTALRKIIRHKTQQLLSAQLAVENNSNEPQQVCFTPHLHSQGGQVILLTAFGSNKRSTFGSHGAPEIYPSPEDQQSYYVFSLEPRTIALVTGNLFLQSTGLKTTEVTNVKWQIELNHQIVSGTSDTLEDE